MYAPAPTITAATTMATMTGNRPERLAGRAPRCLAPPVCLEPARRPWPGVRRRWSRPSGSALTAARDGAAEPVGRVAVAVRPRSAERDPAERLDSLRLARSFDREDPVLAGSLIAGSEKSVSKSSGVIVAAAICLAGSAPLAAPLRSGRRTGAAASALRFHALNGPEYTGSGSSGPGGKPRTALRPVGPPVPYPDRPPADQGSASSSVDQLYAGTAGESSHAGWSCSAPPRWYGAVPPGSGAR